MGFFKLLIPLSYSIIKLQDSNQNKTPSSLAVPQEVSRGGALPLHWDIFHQSLTQCTQCTHISPTLYSTLHISAHITPQRWVYTHRWKKRSFEVDDKDKKRQTAFPWGSAFQKYLWDSHWFTIFKLKTIKKKLYNVICKLRAKIKWFIQVTQRKLAKARSDFWSQSDAKRSFLHLGSRNIYQNRKDWEWGKKGITLFRML